MTAIIIGGLVGVAAGGALGALLFGGLAYSKGFEQGLCDGKSQSLRGVSNGGSVHAEGLTDVAR